MNRGNSIADGKNLDRRSERSTPTSISVKDNSTYIVEDYDSEIDYIPETNYDSAIWVRGHEIAIYCQEVRSKGTNFVKRRLTRQGLEIKSGGWVYVPPSRD